MILKKRVLTGAISCLLLLFLGQTYAFGVQAPVVAEKKPVNLISLHSEIDIFPKNQITNLFLRDTDVRSVLRIIAKEGRKNIVIDDSVTGYVNADLKNVTLNQALESIINTQELDVRTEGGTIYVASRPAMARKGLNRRYIQAFKLNNANSVDVAKLLEASVFNKGYKVNESTTQSQPQVTQAQGAQSGTQALTQGTTTGQSTLVDAKTIRGKVETLVAGGGFSDADKLASQIKVQGVNSATQDITVSNNDGGAIVIPDTRTNSVLVCGLKQDIALAADAIRYLDRKLPQVSIEVSLVELKKTKVNDYNLSLGMQSNKGSTGFNNNVLLPNVNVIAADSVQDLTDKITAQIQYSIEHGTAKLLANPTVMALDGSESLIKITDQIVSKMTVTTTTQGVVTYSPELSDIGIVLNILPKIGSDGYITMKVRPSVTTPLEKVVIGSGFATLISTREVILQDARVKAGQTLAIAGLIKDQEIEKLYKVPVVSDLPIFGKLFTNRNMDKSKSELVILITPKLVDDVQAN